MSGLDYRTWGETKNCKGCRYWSEMLAIADGCGPMKAMCLSDTKRGFTPGSFKCESWEEGSLGAIDDPGGNPYEEMAAGAPPAC